MRSIKLKQSLAALLISIAPSSCYETIEISNPAHYNSDTRTGERDVQSNNSGISTIDNLGDLSEFRDLPEQYYPSEEQNQNNGPSCQYTNKCERDNLIRTANDHLCERVTYRFAIPEGTGIIIRNHNHLGEVDLCGEIACFPPVSVSGILNGDSQNCLITVSGLEAEDFYCNEQPVGPSEEFPGWLQCGRRR